MGADTSARIMIDSGSIEWPARMPRFHESEVKVEPMLFNCDLEHAFRLGGPITRTFLHRIGVFLSQGPVVVDTRVHMLMPGFCPCIPGWHHDDVPRTRSDGQPNYGPGQDRSEHVMALVGSPVSRTKFAHGRAAFKDVPVGSVIYGQWHREVVAHLNAGRLSGWTVPIGSIVQFDDRTWHRGTRSTGTGWRWFGRVSRYRDSSGKPIDRRNARTNEVRRQVQVYLSRSNSGW